MRRTLSARKGYRPTKGNHAMHEYESKVIIKGRWYAVKVRRNNTSWTASGIFEDLQFEVQADGPGAALVSWSETARKGPSPMLAN